MVYVINYNGEPLMPCSNVIARLLLKQRKSWMITKKKIVPIHPMTEVEGILGTLIKQENCRQCGLLIHRKRKGYQGSKRQ